jgi:hypothetical protein
MLNWLGGAHEAERFDLDAIIRALAMLRLLVEARRNGAGERTNDGAHRPERAIDHEVPGPDQAQLEAGRPNAGRRGRESQPTR